MVQAAPTNPAKTYLSSPQTKRGYQTPLMMTEGNTHIVYATGDNLVFQGRKGAPDHVYNGHKQRITGLGHLAGNEYAFGDETGVVSQFTFTAEGRFEMGKQRPMLAGPIKAIKFFHESKPA